MKKTSILLCLFVLVFSGMAFVRPNSQPAKLNSTLSPTLEPLPAVDEFPTDAERQSYLQNTLLPVLESAAGQTYAPGWVQLNIDTYDINSAGAKSDGTLSRMPISHQSHWYLLVDDQLILQHHQTLTDQSGAVTQQMASIGARQMDLISGQIQTIPELATEQVAMESVSLLNTLMKLPERLQVFGSYEAARPLVVIVEDNRPTSQTHATADKFRYTIDPASGLIIQIESFDCTAEDACALSHVEIRSIGRVDAPPVEILSDLNSLIQ